MDHDQLLRLSDDELRRKAPFFDAQLRLVSDAGVVRLAAWAVGSMEDHASAEALVGLLKHRDPGVRRAAAWALGRL